MFILRRRFVLERDPPFDVKGALGEIRRLQKWGTAELVFALNVSRGTLAGWEVRGSRPNVDDADAIRKLLLISRRKVTEGEQQAA